MGDNVYREIPPHPKYLSITLTYHKLRDIGDKPAPYQVRQITDTTQYKPTDWMGKDTVHALCLSPQWAVTIVDFDYIGHITGVVGLAGTVAAKAAVA